MGHAALRAAAVGPVGTAVTVVAGAMGVTGAGGAPRAAVADPPAPALAATWVPGQQVRAHARASNPAADHCTLEASAWCAASFGSWGSPAEDLAR